MQLNKMLHNNCGRVLYLQRCGFLNSREPRGGWGGVNQKKNTQHTTHTGGDDGSNSAHVIGEEIQRLLAISAAAVQNVNLSA